MYVLYFIMAFSYPPMSHPVAITAEHSSQAKCEAARDMLRENAVGRILVARCMPK
jgi:hypothetical protein